MVQVENEYGSYASDKVYLGKLRDMIVNAGFNVPLMTCDGAGQMDAGYVDGTLPTVNGAVGEDIFKAVDRHPERRTLFCGWNFIRHGSMCGELLTRSAITDDLPNSWIGC